MASDAPLITRAEAEAALFGGNIMFAPIRHHSPACAWAVRQMIRDHQPEVVLIEGPSDLGHHLAHMAEPDLVLPVAITTLGPNAARPARAEGGAGSVGPHSVVSRSVSYYPMSEHSPEWVAIREAQVLGVEVRLIDMPVAKRLSETEPPRNLQSEAPFNSADFVRATCRRLRLRDGLELWDHLFEARLGNADWKALMADIYVYCLAMRESTDAAVMEADRTFEREAEMRRHIGEIAGKRALVVTGGFHTPALIAGGDVAQSGTRSGAKAAAKSTAKPATQSGSKPVAIESYLIGYGEEALDALSGYGAGLRYPGWYARAWRAALEADGPPDWAELALQTTLGFAGTMAGDDRRVPLPQLVEMVGMAEGLARMRGREAVLLHDIFDGMKTALIKEQAGPGEPYSERMDAYLRGSALGRAPKAAGLPPIVADARERATRNRVDMNSSERRPKKLDIRRKQSHRAASHFLHQMSLLGSGLGEVESGPDFLTGHRTDLLFEQWLVGWSPLVEGRLIEAARLGPSVPLAASHCLSERIKVALDAALDPWLTLVLTGLRAGLGSTLPQLVDGLAEAVGTSSDFSGLGQVILRLSAAARPGDPLYDPEAPDLAALADRAINRLCDLLPDLIDAPDEALPERIEALRIVAGLLQSQDREEGRQRQRFDNALAGLLDSAACPPLLSGGVMGLLVNAGLQSSASLATLLSGTLGGIGWRSEERVAALRGLLITAPSLLWQDSTVLQAADDAIEALGEAGFMEVLPDLRYELTRLNPHETDRLAEELVTLIGDSAGELTARTGFTEADMARALRLDSEVRRILAADGVAP